MNKLKEVLRLKLQAKLSHTQIKTLTGVSRSSISDYTIRLQASGLNLQEALSLDDESLEKRLWPHRSPLAPEIQTHSATQKPLPDFASIHLRLKEKGTTRELLWEEYREQHPDGLGLSQFKLLYRNYAKTLNPSMRQIHYAGDKLFVDFSGLTLPYVDSATGEVKQAQIFVSVLGASGYTFVHACESQSTQDFIECHTQAFEFYGGVPHILVPDNLKAAVIQHTRDKLILNQSYADMARHYGVAIVPARPYHPQDKPKVESGVKGIQRWILARLRHSTFFSVDEINEAFSPLLDRYNQKLIKRLKQSRVEQFETIDAPALHALPANRYQYREVQLRTVGIDYHVELGAHGYSVPFKHVGQKVEVWISRTSVTITLKAQTIAVHPRLHGTQRQDSTLLEHMPKAHQYQYEKWNPGRILNWAQRIGPKSKELMESIMAHRSHPVRGYRSCMAILSMERTYGKESLELACAKALELKTRSVSAIEGILKHKRYKKEKLPVANNTLFDGHDNIRGSQYYAGGDA